MAKYSISPKAINDLSDIWEYTYTQWSKSQADFYHNLIIEQIEVLASSPLNGIARDYVREGYRSFPVKSHVIFYKVIDDKSIEVIRILHQAMDVDSKL